MMKAVAALHTHILHDGTSTSASDSSNGDSGDNGGSGGSGSDGSSSSDGGISGESIPVNVRFIASSATGEAYTIPRYVYTLNTYTHRRLI